MPERGYKSITVPEDLYKKLQKLAEETHRTVPGLIGYLLDEFEKLAEEEVKL
jgi:predicted transcriptional regulator